MDSLLSLTDHYVRTEAVFQSAANSGIFPAISTSIYYPYAYKGCICTTLKRLEILRPAVRALPQVLSEHGHSTGVITASNPSFNRWARHLERLWNDGLSGVSTDVVPFGSPLHRQIRKSLQIL